MERNKTKGFNYAVMDNFMEAFKLEQTDLIRARKEAEALTKEFCDTTIKSGIMMKRCDNLMWFKDLETETFADTSISKIYLHVSNFTPMLN